MLLHAVCKNGQIDAVVEILQQSGISLNTANKVIA